MSVRAIVFSRYDDLLARFLASAERSQPGSSASVIVGHDSLEHSEQFSACTMVPVVGGDDFCAPAAFNRCVSEAGSDDIILFGDDMEILTPNWLDAAERLLNEWPDGYGVINMRQDTMETCTDLVELLGPDIGVPVIPRRTLETVGLLDERFIGYGYSDYDYCLRLWHAGLKIGRVGSVEVKHDGLAASIRKLGSYEAVIAQCDVNRDRFYEKWGATDNVFAVLHYDRVCGCDA